LAAKAIFTCVLEAGIAAGIQKKTRQDMEGCTTDPQLPCDPASNLIPHNMITAESHAKMESMMHNKYVQQRQQ